MDNNEVKIKRLEKQIVKLKEDKKDLIEELNRLEGYLSSERRWRLDFYAFIKAGLTSEPLEEYERNYS